MTSTDAAAPRPVPRVPVAFLLALTALTLLFLVLAIRRSNRSTLRGDEVTTLFHNRDGRSLLEVALRGETRQVSRAPLSYLVDRILDASRHRLLYFGLTPPGYYRLPSVLFTAGFGAAGGLLAAGRVRRQDAPRWSAYVLILCALATFWFHPKVFSFACTDRPYSLWNGLWFLTLALLLCRPGSRVAILVTLCLLASVASAACFQILAIGIATLIVRRLEGQPLRQTLLDGAKVLGLPALIGAYYALLSSPFAFEDRDYGDAAQDFVRFWLLTNLPAWVAAAAACALTLPRPRLRSLALPGVVLAILLLQMPLIFSLAYWKGYSSPSRQYLWTATAVPVALLLAAVGWQELRAWRPAPVLAITIGLGLALSYGVATFARPQRRNDSRDLACLAPGSPLVRLLRTERPRRLLYSGELGDIESKNVHLIAEWISVRFRDRPFGEAEVFLQDAGGKLQADSPGPASKTGWIGVVVPP